jgi:hypothetical protein
VALFKNAADVYRAFTLLSAALEAQQVGPYEMVVIGGAALRAGGVGIRSTKDVDVLGLRETVSPGHEVVVVKHKLLPGPLLQAANTVADALGLSSDWLNSGPADLLDFGLPEGFEERLTSVYVDTLLTVWVPSRLDLICLKTYAADTGPGRHTDDLRALEATCAELHAGVCWARSQDPSESFSEMLCGLLRFFGCEAAAQEIMNG